MDELHGKVVNKRLLKHKGKFGQFSKPGLDFLLPKREGCTERVLTFR